jgi:hypothetical protein
VQRRPALRKRRLGVVGGLARCLSLVLLLGGLGSGAFGVGACLLGVAATLAAELAGVVELALASAA